MKVSLKLLLILCIAALMSYCGKKSESEADQDEWPEMDSFHMVMAEAYHPYKDSSNLAPARKLAEEMALEAERWQGSDLPKKVNNDEMKGMLEKLKAGTRAFSDRVNASAPDEELGNTLTAIHDSFHAITEKWYGGHGKKEHEH
jgi:hypothetical protein